MNECIQRQKFWQFLCSDVASMAFQALPQIAWCCSSIIALITFVWFWVVFSSVGFQMSPQAVCPSGYKVTLTALMCFYSTVSFHMSPQSVCADWCIVTLVAFVRLFTSVNLHMFFQTTRPNRCIGTLAALIWFFTTMNFQMNPQITCIYKITAT